MTQPERHTPDGGAPAPPATSGVARTVNGPPPGALGEAWEAIFEAAAPSRRQELLELAARQGLLYAHQLPPPNGAAKRPFLPALLTGQLQDLPPLRPAPLACGDARLDEDQRDAVARAVQTPDICLIRGHPGSGKSRTAAEIVARAAAGGERVLLLAPSAAAVDCVLERLEGLDGVCAARCLGPGEHPEALAPGLRRLLLEERIRAFREDALPAARQAAADAASACARRREDAAVWPEVADLARRCDVLRGEDARLAEALACVASEVAAESDPPEKAAGWLHELTARRAARDESVAHLDAGLADLRSETEKVRREQEAAAQEAARLRPLADSRGAGRWWTRDWWRARREGDVARRIEELDRRRGELSAAGENLAREAERLNSERAATEARFQEEAAQLRRRETDRRRAELEGRRAAVAGELERLDDQARAAYGRLSDAASAPRQLCEAAVAAARRVWETQCEEGARAATRAAGWAEAAEAALAVLPDRLARGVNVVGATPPALVGDGQFGDRASAQTTFDVLVLDEAHLVTESEFLAAARRARRWVLLGEPGDAQLSLPERDRARGAARPAPLRPGVFERLWRALHAEPAALPYAWLDREGRLVCRLRRPSPDEERWVETERLADRPEIELRIAAPPRTAPRLLEVVFPAGAAVHEAKGFIFRELGELTVQARGRRFRWREEADRLILDFSDGDTPQSAVVDLGEGVCERLADGGGRRHTCSLEFDRAAGWTRERAARWVEERLPLRDAGRTAALDAPHRARPALAAFLSGLLFDGACGPRLPICPVSGGEVSCAVEFVPVPPLDADWGRRRHEPEGRGRRGGTAAVAPRVRPARGGAGLEIDLADPRRLDPLPPDLRAALPRQGLVNLFEARAVVRKLEALAADAAFRADAGAWAAGQGRSPGAVCGSVACQGAAIPCVGRRPAVAVLALYPAQAELIRLLAARSAALAAAPVALEFATPDAFRQRECFTAVVSLTRSHAHRAVTFGADPTLLPAALTRAAARVVLFGDPGTLARRAQWNGPVDHLDEAAAERERARVAHLVAYLHGQGPHPSLFGIDESGRA